MAPKKTKNKKRKAEAKTSEELKSIWLLKFVNEFTTCEQEQVEELVFSTKERAIAAMPKVMDKNCPHGKDWRNGLKGFGRRKEDNYLCYQYFGDTIGDDGGVLISNDADYGDDDDKISVHLKRLQIDPYGEEDAKPNAVAEEEEDGSSSSDDDANNCCILQL